jgi:hypothetical protein
MNINYKTVRKLINKLPPKRWEGYEPETLANLTHDEAWKKVREFPACVGQIPNATAEMQAYALTRRGYLLFESVPWLIDTDFVAPGSTAWALNYAAEYAKYRDDKTAVGTQFRMTTLETSWSEIRIMAEWAPDALPENVRDLIGALSYANLVQFINDAKQLNKSRRAATEGV